jgi:hypothetical protein
MRHALVSAHAVDVQRSALGALKNRTLDRERFASARLGDKPDAIRALVARLEDPDWKTVCAAAAIF